MKWAFLGWVGYVRVGASNRNLLQAVLTADYDDLVRRLTRRFGNRDFASETLHDTYVQLQSVPDTTLINSPKDYLFRTAINVGTRKRTTESRKATAKEIDSILDDIGDDSAGPARIAEARSEVDALMQVLSELPERTRKAFAATIFDGHSCGDIAEELGVSVSTVEKDIQRAVELCSRRLGRTPTRRTSGPRWLI